jgi:hypothetical protein
MARTKRRTPPPGRYTWDSPGKGKAYKRAHNKAVRQLVKGHGGKVRCVARTASECNWKAT